MTWWLSFYYLRVMQLSVGVGLDKFGASVTLANEINESLQGSHSNFWMHILPQSNLILLWVHDSRFTYVILYYPYCSFSPASIFLRLFLSQFYYVYEQYFNLHDTLSLQSWCIRYSVCIHNCCCRQRYYVVGLCYWLFRNTPEPYTPAKSLFIDTTTEESCFSDKIILFRVHLLSYHTLLILSNENTTIRVVRCRPILSQSYLFVRTTF